MGFLKEVWDKTFGGDSIFGMAIDALGITDVWENGLQLEDRLGMNEGSEDAVLGTADAATDETASVQDNDEEGSPEVANVGSDNVGGEGSQADVPNAQTNTAKRGSLVAQGSPTFEGGFGFTKELGA